MNRLICLALVFSLVISVGAQTCFGEEANEDIYSPEILRQELDRQLKEGKSICMEMDVYGWCDECAPKILLQDLYERVEKLEKEKKNEEEFGICVHTIYPPHDYPCWE